MSTRTDLAEQPVRCEVEMELLRRQRELLAYMEDKLAQPSASWPSVQRQTVPQVAQAPASLWPIRRLGRAGAGLSAGTPPARPALVCTPRLARRRLAQQRPGVGTRAPGIHHMHAVLVTA